MKKSIILTTLAISSAVANAAIISVNVTDGGPGFGATISSTQLAGVVEAGNWNVVSFETGGTTNAHAGTNTGNLLDDAGANSGVSISSTGTWGRTFNNSTGFNTGTALFNDSMITNYSDTNTGSITLTGVSYATYDVYVYSSRPFVQEAGFTVGGVSRFLAFDLNATSGPLEEGSFATQALAEGSRGTGNYIKFSGVTGSSLTIQAESVGNFMSVNGIQIVQVPEPSSTALLGLGGLALILRRRK